MKFQPLSETVDVEGVTFTVYELTGVELANLSRNPKLKNELAYGLEALRLSVQVLEDGKATRLQTAEFEELPKRVIDQVQQAFNRVNAGGRKEARDATIRAALALLPDDAPEAVTAYLNDQLDDLLELNRPARPLVPPLERNA